MTLLLILATGLQVVAVAYGFWLLRKHQVAAKAWLCLLGALVSMLVWRIVVTTGITPGLSFNTVIAIWGSACAVLAMFYFGREVARRERAEAERDRLLESERIARSEAERASRVKDEFLATLSHELRSPLAAILGWCAILRKSPTLGHAERAVETIDRNARIQARLVDDLLDATRMQAGSLHLDVAAVSLDGPVAAAIEAVRPAADARRVAIRYNGVTPAPVVAGDASRLQQIVGNLLTNAVKFTAEDRSIHISLACRDGRAELTVADEGIGIDASFMPHLFKRFRQADTGNARRHGGLGLGLSIVSQLVQLHHGEIRAVSPGIGMGATFIVHLPLAGAAAAEGSLGRTTVLGRDETAPTLDGVKVIVVDDEADLRDAVSGLLEQAGAFVLALDSGAMIESALAEVKPDVLVLDIGMPGEDGYALIRRIRRLPREAGGEVPAISLTSHARDEDRRHAIANGFHAHLAKPVHVAQLAATIKAIAAAGTVTSSPHTSTPA